MATLYGVPKTFDVFIRPIVRAGQLVFAVIATLPLLWFQLWIWVPIPAALSFLAYEYFFWRRGDRPCELTLDGTTLTLVDVLQEQSTEVDLSQVAAATLWSHHLPDGSERAILSLWYADEHALGLEFRPGRAAHPAAVDGDAWDAHEGGLSAILPAVTPAATRGRQVFEDRDGSFLGSLVAQIPPNAFERTRVRVWQGAAPDLDLFGFHSGDPTGVLELDKAQWRWVGETKFKKVSKLERSPSQRQAMLLKFFGDPEGQSDEVIPLRLLKLGPLTLGYPTPMLVDTLGDPAPASTLHLHVPDGAALEAHLARYAP